MYMNEKIYASISDTRRGLVMSVAENNGAITKNCPHNTSLYNRATIFAVN